MSNNSGKSESESGDQEIRSFVRGISLEDEEFHLRDVRRNSYVKGAVVMAGSILPADLSSRHNADRTCVHVLVMHQFMERTKEIEKKGETCTMHVTQMKLK